jgi:hypothetical protein
MSGIEKPGRRVPGFFSSSDGKMPRRRATKTTRRALSASELDSKIMEMLCGLKACAKLKGVSFVFVGSFGQEPNWHARPLPARVSEACMREFVKALTFVRRQFDLLAGEGKERGQQTIIPR